MYYTYNIEHRGDIMEFEEQDIYELMSFEYGVDAEEIELDFAERARDMNESFSGDR